MITANPPEHLTRLERFGFEVRQVRIGRNLTQSQLATGVGYSVAYVSRVETGAVMPSLKFAQGCDLVLGTHGIFERLRERIEKGDHPSWFAPYADLEKDATSILDYSTSLIMGMLQTPQYAESIFRARHPRESDHEIKGRVEARIQRRMVMQRKDPPLLWVILHENCLRAHIGGLGVMRDQIAHLISQAQSPHVMLQVLPIRAGAPPATESFTVLRFKGRSDIVYVDSTFTGQVIESTSTVEDAKETYDRLRAAALNPDESIALMQSTIKEFEK
ncbi:MAG: helix-turn-helix transcriptional regulator [Streptomycetaceae bacterium]|nr:helix-turn-helix transcriptional regulator [Streptomycetaceae bacterium]